MSYVNKHLFAINACSAKIWWRASSWRPDRDRKEAGRKGFTEEARAPVGIAALVERARPVMSAPEGEQVTPNQPCVQGSAPGQADSGMFRACFIPSRVPNAVAVR